MTEYSYDLTDTTSIDKNVILSNTGYKLTSLGDVSLNTRLIVGGDVGFNSKLIVMNDVSFNSKLNVVSDVALNSKLLVTGKTNKINDVSINSKLFVGGDVSFNSKLYVSGITNLFGDASFNGNLSIDGITKTHDIIPFGNLVSDIGNETKWFGNLYVNHLICGPNSITIGNSMITSTDNQINIPGDFYIGTNFAVQGDVSMGSNVKIHGNLNVEFCFT